jgi:MoxR-like ATPase
MLVATQNPFEFEGTYYLPENQLDRFLLRIAVGYPERSAEHRILTTQPGRGALDELKPVMHAEDVVRFRTGARRSSSTARSSITSSIWSKRRGTTSSCTWASPRAGRWR